MIKKKLSLINIIIFVQYILVNITSIYNIPDDVTKHISLLLLITGYWINPK